MDITNLNINDGANAGGLTRPNPEHAIERLQTRVAELEECLKEIRLWTDDECAIESINEVMGDVPEAELSESDVADIKAEMAGELERERRMGL